jgi:hypothetical protein
MLKRYKIYLYLEERIPMTIREIVRVAHDEFREMGLPDMGWFMAMDETPVLVDVRRMFDRAEAERRGIYYRRL